MRPSSLQLLHAIADNLAEVPLPANTTAQTRNTLTCAVLLLRHVAARAQLEVTLLREDNADKRRTLTLVGQRLEAVAKQREAPELVDLAARTKARIPRSGALKADAGSLAAENERLKAQMALLLTELRDHRDDLGEEASVALLNSVRRQLRRQIDRELRLLPAEMNQPVYDIGLPTHAASWSAGL